MSDQASARLDLPYLAAGQMQKHVTLNEALTRLDALVQCRVASRTVTAAPADPEDGVLYILPAGATGVGWAGRPAGTLVRAELGHWSVVAAPDGTLARVADEAGFVVRIAGAWTALGSALGAVQDLTRLGLGTAADADSPFAAKLNKALWTARGAGEGGDGDLRLTLNKEAAADVLSLLFQTGYGGRAELGLIGDDDLQLKVSADGAAWTQAARIDRVTGRVWFDAGAGRRETTVFTASGTYVVPTWARSIEAVVVSGGGGGANGAFGASGVRLGGGGGQAGGVARVSWSAAAVSGSLTVTIGVGGAAGLNGTKSSVARGGVNLARPQNGQGGLAAAGGDHPLAGNPGGTAASGAGGVGPVRYTAGPGAGGAGATLAVDGSTGTSSAGGAGATELCGSAGGAAGSGGAGGAGADAPLPDANWAGGGGGGGGASASGAGFPGGAGGAFGAGGGGGGAGVTAGGAGGSGASGVVWLTAVG